MKLSLISDTHGQHNLIKNMGYADVFIHAGDFMWSGKKVSELVDFNKWLGTVPAALKIVVPGNHDILMDQKDWFDLASTYIPNAIFLINESLSYRGFKFYGSPQTPTFFDWAFMADRGPAIKKYWDKIPDDTEILITHGPPMGICDTAYLRGPDLGCADLRKRVDELQHLRLHVFGHIHGSKGKMHLEPEKTRAFHNISFLNEQYSPSTYNLSYVEINK